MACHSDTGEIADFEEAGSFRRSETELTLMGHIEDLGRFEIPDYDSMAVLSGETLVYNTAGSVVDGDFSIMITL